MAGGEAETDAAASRGRWLGFFDFNGPSLSIRHQEENRFETVSASDYQKERDGTVILAILILSRRAARDMLWVPVEHFSVS